MTTTLARLPRAIRALGFAPLAVLAAALAMAGCVTKETYTAQVNRTTNLQRLLAEEEKRSADLAVEIARLKKQAGDLEAQNKLTTTQLTEARAQVVRSLEEVGRLQEEVQKGRQSAKTGASKSKKSLGAAPTPTEPPDRLDELQGGSGMKATSATPSLEGGGSNVYHEVKRGDTLFNIAKRYHIDVKTIRELNDLTRDEIRVGERLIVGKKEQ